MLGRRTPSSPAGGPDQGARIREAFELRKLIQRWARGDVREGPQAGITSLYGQATPLHGVDAHLDFVPSPPRAAQGLLKRENHPGRQDKLWLRRSSSYAAGMIGRLSLAVPMPPRVHTSTNRPISACWEKRGSFFYR